MSRVTLCFLGLTMGLSSASAQTTLFDSNIIQQIEIEFTEPNWDFILDTAKAGTDSYLMAASVTINGVELDSVGVKYKGSSSYDPTYTKNALHLSINEFVNQDFEGIKDIKLSNGYGDPSHIREALSYSILTHYMHCPRANFAQVYVNGSYYGLMTNAESIGKAFLKDHFFSSKHTFIKANPILDPGPTIKSNLKYISNDSSDYLNYYEMKSDYGWNELVDLCDTIAHVPAVVSTIMDMDRFIWMLAFNNVLVNLDSYSGAFAQNYYLYRDSTRHFNPIVWDLNLSFGGLPFAGSSNTSLGSLTLANMQQMSPTLHATDPYWPMINVVMNNPMYKRMYMAHLRTMVTEMFANGEYQTRAATMQAIIDTAVQSDANAFFTYSEFQNGMTTDMPFANYTIPGIANLMQARVTSLQANADYVLVAPVINTISASNGAPTFNDVVSISASVSGVGSGAVYLGLRFSAEHKFVRNQMFDDGLHSDGAAGDGVFGLSFTMLAGGVQYYIYAENTDAGVFSPARAEHEFHSLGTPLAVPQLADDEPMFGIYPNPATDVVTLDLGDRKSLLVQIEMYNAMGQRVLTTSANGPTVRLSVANLPSGVYLVRMNGKFGQRLVVGE